MKTVKKLIDSLQKRGLIQTASQLENISINGIYMGIDPTGKSLHLGHLIPLKLLEEFRNIGVKTVVLMGDMTAQIGDPSFRNKTRPILSLEDCKKNSESIISQLHRIFPGHILRFNSEFYKSTGILEWLSEFGTHINMGNLIHKEFLKSRLQTGLTVKEMLYPLFQASDFYLLHRDEGINCQIGGEDQWGNLTIGMELVRKKSGSKELCAMTAPLLLDAEGKKLGKTSDGGTIFLDPKLTSPFSMFQYLINCPDSVSANLLKLLTNIELEELTTLNPVEIQTKLALDVVSLVHGPKEAAKAKDLSNKLFLGSNLSQKELDGMLNGLPTIEINSPDLVEALKNLGLISSNRELKELIKTEGLRLNGELMTLTSQLSIGINLIKRGKNRFGLINYLKN